MRGVQCACAPHKMQINRGVNATLVAVCWRRRRRLRRAQFPTSDACTARHTQTPANVSAASLSRWRSMTFPPYRARWVCVHWSCCDRCSAIPRDFLVTSAHMRDCPLASETVRSIQLQIGLHATIARPVSNLWNYHAYPRRRAYASHHNNFYMVAEHGAPSIVLRSHSIGFWPNLTHPPQGINSHRHNSNALRQDSHDRSSSPSAAHLTIGNCVCWTSIKSIRLMVSVRKCCADVIAHLWNLLHMWME